MSLQNKVESFWYLPPRKVRWLLPINFLLVTLVKIRRSFYTLGLLKANTCGQPLVVVGNISVGGTGKTPFIAQFVALLAKHKIRAGIISRGYKAAAKNYPHRLTENDSATLVGDEAYMLFRSLGVPIVIDPNRSRAAQCLAQRNDIDIIISDDGLQHYQMGREVEIVLLDADRRFGNKLMLPFGPLREPVSRLKKVDLIIANGETSNEACDAKVNLINVSLVQLTTGKHFKFDKFSSQQVNAVAGIGHTVRFFTSLSKACKIKSESSYPDHYPFTLQDFEPFGDELVVMTEKDASKCYPFAKSTWYYLKVEMNFDTALESRLMKLVRPLIARSN